MKDVSEYISTLVSDVVSIDGCCDVDVKSGKMKLNQNNVCNARECPLPL